MRGVVDHQRWWRHGEGDSSSEGDRGDSLVMNPANGDSPRRLSRCGEVLIDV
jgi:hypothetical protein